MAKGKLHYSPVVRELRPCTTDDCKYTHYESQEDYAADLAQSYDTFSVVSKNSADSQCPMCDRTYSQSVISSYGSCDPCRVDRENAEWGRTKIEIGSNTPWGKADYVKELAEGVVTVSTPGHGGIKLSRTRNKAIPVGLRNQDAWYEEDAESYIVGMYHPETHMFSANKTRGESRDACERKVRQYFPAGYEKATGKTIPFGESTEKDKATYRAESEYVIGGKSYKSADGTEYRTLIGKDGSEQWVEMNASDAQELVSATPEKYGAAPRFLLPSLVPESVAAGLKFTDDPRPKPSLYHGLQDYSNFTEIAKEKIENTLAQRYRDDSGKVRTLREIIDNEGITAKTVTVENGKRKYRLERAVGSDGVFTSFAVDKATFDAVNAPDTRTKADHAILKIRVLQDNVDMVQRRIDSKVRPTAEDFQSLRKAKDKLAAAQAALQARIDKES